MKHKYLQFLLGSSLIIMMFFSFSDISFATEIVKNLEIAEKSLHKVIDEQGETVLERSEKIDDIKSEESETVDLEDIDDKEEILLQENTESDDVLAFGGGIESVLNAESVEPENHIPQAVSPESFLEGSQGNFQTDIFTGGVSYSYPIQIPKGRNGMMPQVNLHYSSLNTQKDTILAHGWDVSVSSIFRSTRLGVDKLYSEDHFSANIEGMVFDLVLVNKEQGIYMADTEGGFMQFIQKENSWEVRNGGGTTYSLGISNSGRQYDPENPKNVYRWMLEKKEDTRGNYVSYEYEKHENQVYPKRILYTAFDNGVTKNNGIYEVNFITDFSGKTVTSYTTGFQVKTEKMVTGISVYATEGGNKKLVREYEFDIEVSNSVQKYLQGIEVKNGSLKLPRTNFTYWNGREKRHNVIQKRGLLQSIEFPYGGSQKFTYKQAHAYKNGEGEIQNRLPFIAYTLHTSEIQAGEKEKVSRTTYEYENAHYYFDNREAHTREYAGFGKVTSVDPVGNVSMQYFHQSEFSPDNVASEELGEYKDHISKKGKVYRVEQYDNNENLYTVEISKWDTKELESLDAIRSRYFPHLEEKVSITYDGYVNTSQKFRRKSRRKNKFRSGKAVAVKYAYDNYGNIVEQEHFGEVRLRSDRGVFRDEKNDSFRTEMKYAINPEKYLIRFIHEQTIFDADNNIIGKTQKLYDNLPLGKVSYGHITENKILSDINSGREKYLVSEQKFNEYGLVTQVKDARGNATYFTYDSFNLYPVEVQNAKGHTQKIDYDYRFGIPVFTQDPNGVVSKTVVDNLGRTKEVLGTDNLDPTKLISKIKYEYQLFQQPVALKTSVVIHDSNTSEISSYKYIDGLGREIQNRSESFDENGDRAFVVTEKDYDIRGNVARESLPIFSKGAQYKSILQPFVGTSYAYDPVNRVTRVDSPVGTTYSSYDRWETTVVNPNNQKKTSEHDAFGRVVAVNEYINNRKLTTEYVYDTRGSLTQIVDAQKNKRDFAYDLLGRRVSASQWYRNGGNPQHFWTYTYDANGNIVEKTDPRGNVISYVYDELNRVVEDRSENSPILYTYDTGEYAIGKLVTLSKPEYLLTMKYDVLGNVIEKNETIAGNNFRTTLKTNRNGLVTHIGYPNNTQVEHNYNALLQLEGVDYIAEDGGRNSVVESIAYNPLSKMTKLTYGNGVEVENVYDFSQAYRLVEKRAEKAGEEIQNITYTYDYVGNITSVKDAIHNEISVHNYDDLNRLIQTDIRALSVEGGENILPIELQYAYDDIGNIISKSNVGEYVYEESNPQQLSRIEGIDGNDFVYEYDEAGNIVEKNDQIFIWNERGQLMETTNSNGLDGTFIYDPSGKRVLKNVNGDTVVYSGEIYQKHDTGDTAYIFAGNQRVATVENSDELVSFVVNTELVASENDIVVDPVFEETEDVNEDDVGAGLMPAQTEEGDENNTDVDSVPDEVEDDVGTGLVPAQTEEVEENNTEVDAVSDEIEEVEENNIDFDLVPAQTEEVEENNTDVDVVSDEIEEIDESENDDEKTTKHQNKNGIFFHHPDHLGSGSLSTDIDGIVVEDVRYLPYGEERARAGDFESRFTFTDQERDKDIGLMYYDARYYDPLVGRFMSRDNWEGDYANPQTLNKYSYTVNNPIIYVDPTGNVLILAGSNGDTFNDDVISDLKKISPYVISESLDNGNVNISIDYKKVLSDIVSGEYKKHYGTALIFRNVLNGYTTTIVNSDDEVSNVVADDITFGQGTNTTINYNRAPEHVVRTYDFNTGETTDEVIDNYIELGHELIHSMHFMEADYTGYESDTYRGLDGNTYNAPAEETRTVGVGNYSQNNDITENHLRSENNKNPRNNY